MPDLPTGWTPAGVKEIIALFGGGVVTMVIVLKLLPPLVAAFGTWRRRNGGSTAGPSRDLVDALDRLSSSITSHNDRIDRRLEKIEENQDHLLTRTAVLVKWHEPDSQGRQDWKGMREVLDELRRLSEVLASLPERLAEAVRRSTT